ncbi:MAG: PD-(D/E)XK nuclease family protein, partial [Stenotrophobium sp.]
MNDAELPRLALLPPHADALAWAAQAIVEAQRAALPDLSHLTLILPSPTQIPRLRSLLLQHAGGAMLGPNITTLSGFAGTRGAAPALPGLDCKLILANALRQYPGLFPGQDHWALADALFGLFEELSAATPELAEDEARFLARVERGYGGAGLAQVSREARAVHLLWCAYLRDTAGRSPALARMRALDAAFGGLAAQEQVCLIGFDQFNGSEARTIRLVLQRGQTRLWLQGPAQGRGRNAISILLKQLDMTPVTPEIAADAKAQALQIAFDDSGASLHERAAVITHGDAAIRLALADGPEHEARLVDLAVRRALLAGHTDIAVVTQDRRLARRLRALLERAQVPLCDEGGWALSTSAAAASLGHWLDCCERDFPFRALLDLLKSAFFDSVSAAEIAALETSIYQARVTGGLDNYRALESAQQTLLKQLQRAARAQPAPNAPALPGQEWAAALIQSLQKLPLWMRWQNDDAGIALTAALENLHAALQRQHARLRWSEFRTLLERTLEQSTFIPQTAAGPVRLLTLDQAQGLRCRFLILAGASAAQFPGKPKAEPVFNHGVRAELGLPHWTEHLDLQLARFRALLHAAPDILISYAPEKESENAQPCPWVEALQALGMVRAESELPRLASNPQTEISSQETALPQPESAPRPQLATALLPAGLSAVSHQSLIDCPYQFFAASGLGLHSADEPDEPASRRDFGERVHLIMQAFHQQMPDLPAPFTDPVTPARCVEAETKLAELAHAVFAADLRQRVLAKTWLVEFME